MNHIRISFYDDASDERITSRVADHYDEAFQIVDEYFEALDPVLRERTYYEFERIGDSGILETSNESVKVCRDQD